MIEVATAINSFALMAQQTDFVPPSEQLITLTYAQLQDLVTQAVEKAIQPLQDEISQLKAAMVCQDEKIATLESTEEYDISRLALDIAYDRQRLTKLEKIEPQPLQKDRGEILRALLAANGGKMLAKEARQKMRMDKATFSRLLDALKDFIDIKPFHQDKRQLVLMLKIS